MIRKVFLFVFAVAMMSSCQSLLETARTEKVATNLANATVADLDVYPERVEASIPNVSAELRRGGEENVKRAVEVKALKENGRGDLLVEPQYVVEKKRGLFSTRITSISVSGRPASFKNFRSLNDSVWANPVFRGVSEKKHSILPFLGRSKAPSLKLKPSSSDMGVVENAKPTWRPTGVKSIIEFGGFITVGKGCGFDVTYTLGYQFNPHFFVGIGVGYNHGELEKPDSHKFDSYEVSLRSVPIFAQARWYMTHTKVSPFLDMKLGYYVSCYNTFEYESNHSSYYYGGYSSDHEFNIKDKCFNGVYVHPTFGVAFSTKKGKTVDLGVFYDLHGYKYPERPDYKDGFYDEANNRLGLSLGVTF